MKITHKKLSAVKPYQNNVKSHPEEQIKKIAASISEFGFYIPILIDEHGEHYRRTWPVCGGAQFTNSGFKILRHIRPAAWRRFMLDWRAGEIILAIKHDRKLSDIQEAITRIGGLEYLVETRPHVFDYLRQTPLQGYDK